MSLNPRPNHHIVTASGVFACSKRKETIKSWSQFTGATFRGFKMGSCVCKSYGIWGPKHHIVTASGVLACSKKEGD